jgi:uncharacterized protein (DUF1499 family)
MAKSLMIATCKIAVALLVSTSAGAFTASPPTEKSSTVLAAHMSREAFFRQTASLAIGGLFLFEGGPVQADEGDVAAPSKSIPMCKLQGGGKPSNCVSTSSVKQLDCYVTPWTFEVSADEAKARLKGVFAADPDIYKDLYEEKGYLRINAARGLVMDQLEFVIDEKDSLVKLRSAELFEDTPPSISDFGANRRRLDGIRKAAKVFELMGGGGGYDSIEMRGTGPLGQLKAFYGLQSGSGFEDLYED